jgi:hypothetical protein
MLLILIPIAWLGTLTVLVALCRSAALGDAVTISSLEQPRRRPAVERTLAWPASIAPSASARRPAGHVRSPHSRRVRLPRRGAAGHSLR